MEKHRVTRTNQPIDPGMETFIRDFEEIIQDLWISKDIKPGTITVSFNFPAPNPVQKSPMDPILQKKIVSEGKQILSILKTASMKTFQEKLKILKRIDIQMEKYPPEIMDVLNEPIQNIQDDVSVQQSLIEKSLSKEEMKIYQESFK